MCEGCAFTPYAWLPAAYGRAAAKCEGSPMFTLHTFSKVHPALWRSVKGVNGIPYTYMENLKESLLLFLKVSPKRKKCPSRIHNRRKTRINAAKHVKGAPSRPFTLQETT